MNKVLLFGGTTEGRKLALILAECGIYVHVCVATEYGEALLPAKKNILVTAARLEEEEIKDIIIGEKISHVVDATHPYAVLVTENIISACTKAGVSYYRLLREDYNLDGNSAIIVVENIKQAVEYCKNITGKILLTTGSKDLIQFTKIEDYSNRIYPRILPSAQAVEHCISLGFASSNMICMQGPFSKELNSALFEQFKIDWLVTKESGAVGGFPEKLQAAAESGVKSIVIGRPPQKKGYSFDELFVILQAELCLDLAKTKKNSPPRFPLFVLLTGKKVQVFGAGKVAARRVKLLIPFGCEITIVAPDFNYDLLELAKENKISLVYDVWQTGNCAADFVLAATNNREVNHKIAEECHNKNIKANISDCPAECDFFFPGLIQENGLIIGVCSNGEDHTKVKNTAAEIRKTIRRLEKGEK